MWRSIRLTPRLASIRLAQTFAFRSSQYRPKTTAVDDQGKLLRESPFWNKKIDRAIHKRDVDKDGIITRKDFELAAQRYKDIARVSGEQLQRARKSLMNFADSIGVTDDTKQLTAEEFKTIISNAGNLVEMYNTLFQAMFNGLDINGDGVLSIKEWELHYKCMGIDPKYAKASFEAMDTNGDGVVSLEEFTAYHVEYFCTTENKLNSAILHGPLD